MMRAFTSQIRGVTRFNSLFEQTQGGLRVKRLLSTEPGNPQKKHESSGAHEDTLPPNLDAKKEDKKKRSMTGWYILGTAGLVGSTFYYLNESDRTERMIDRTLRDLTSTNDETRTKGIDSINACLLTKKRVFTGIVEIPTSKEFLIERGIIEALLFALKTSESNTYIRDNVFLWLNRFADEQEGLTRIGKIAVEPVVQTLISSEISSTLWFESASILSKLAHHAGSISAENQPTVTKAVEHLLKSHHPIAVLLGAQLHSYITPSPRPEIAQLIASSPSRVALQSAFFAALPADPTSFHPSFQTSTLINVNWAVFSGLLGSFWGKIRWNFRGRVKRLSGEELSRYVSSHNRVGRYVFILFLLDAITQALLTWPREGVQLPFWEDPIKVNTESLPFQLNWDTTIPITEATLWISMALWGIRRNRFLVLPMFVASGVKYSLQEGWKYDLKTIEEFVRPILHKGGIRDF